MRQYAIARVRRQYAAKNGEHGERNENIRDVLFSNRHTEVYRRDPTEVDPSA